MISFQTIVIRLVLAVVLGALVGLERERSARQVYAPTRLSRSAPAWL